MSSPTPESLRIVALGGLGEFGLNLLVLEHGEDILVIDCGLMFPERAQLGVEIVIPDMTYLFERRHRIRGVLLTHGHEDHIGALPYLLERAPVPVFGSRMTLGLVSDRLRERGQAKGADLRNVAPRQVQRLGEAFEAEFLQVTHSIPDSLALAVRTPAGVVLHSGDFKMDQTPVDGRALDYQRFSHHGDEGVLVLLSDSTNAEEPGYTPSERRVRDGLDILLASAQGRVVISSFSSNIHRVQQILDLAGRYQRFVCFAGRSLAGTTRVAEETGHLRVPPGRVIQSREVMDLPPHRVLIVASGSQGEPRSTLSRIALEDHRDIRLEPGDLVILSARPIPGNERSITRLVNHLTRRGARVVTRMDPPCHVSGHASQEELKLMIGLTRPRFFIPIHGEYRQLAAHARLAEEMRVPRGNILLLGDGDILEIGPQGAQVAGQAPVGTVFIDGAAGEVDAPVLRDRKHLSADGLVIPVVVIDRSTGRMESPPEMVSRGFVWSGEQEDLLEESMAVVSETVRRSSAEERSDWGVLRSKVQDDLRRFLRKRTGRHPMIIPIVIES